MRKCLMVWLVFLLVSVAGVKISFAVNIPAGEWKFGINGFLDAEYTWMNKSPMLMQMKDKAGKVMKDENGNDMWEVGKNSMPEMSFLDQNHLNLLFNAEKGKTQVNINFGSHHAFVSGHDGGENTGKFEIEEAYGVYKWSDQLKLNAGYMLSPFGLYNNVRYISPLFATVVLPQMYEMPHNYSSGHEAISNNLMPSKANLMISGNFGGDSVEINYYLYISNGIRNDDGGDTNRDKGFGARVRIGLLEAYKFGVSYYGVENDVDEVVPAEALGRERLIGADIELNFAELVKLEAEMALDEFDKRDNRYSYYGRLTFYLGNFSPFTSYDYARDDDHLIYQRGQTRIGIGTGYTLSDTVTMKAEYHNHKFHDMVDAPDLPDDTDSINMFRASIIFVF